MTGKIKKSRNARAYSRLRGVKGWFIFGLTSLLMYQTYASNIEIIGATKQSWAGGVSYRRGISYNIELKIYPSKYPVILDSLWLEGNCRSLASYNYKGKSKSDTLSVYIIDGLNYDGGIQVDATWCKDPTKNGVIISYHQHNQRFLLDVTPYLKELFPVHYP